MKHELNHLNQPIGTVVRDWKTPSEPQRENIDGQYCRLEPLDPILHAVSLWTANALDIEGSNWTYLSYGPFETLEDYRIWIEQNCFSRDPLFYAMVDLTTEKAVGVASYLRISPHDGSIEVGHLNFSPLLQHTRAGTEAMYLMMARAFGLGYRRYEWKCNALNLASRSAALRLGMSFEGLFRQATIVKGRNRDTAWYSAIDHEWPSIQIAFLAWLSPSNFDEHGNQRSQLSSLMAAALKRHT